VRIAVVIVNYRTAGLVQECLRSLWRLRAGDATLTVTVVDNCSGDGSLQQLRTFLRSESGPWPVRLVGSAINGGFAHGNNVALRNCIGPGRTSAPDLVWLLNPDTCVRATDLQPVLDFLAQHPRAGIVGNRIVDRDGRVQTSAFRRHTWLSELDSALSMGFVTALLRQHVVAPPPPAQPTRVDWVSGASMFIRAEVLARVGLLDDGYFMYFEETDYCLAAQAAGFEAWYCPVVDVAHLEGAASGVHARSRKRRPRYWFASRARFFRKNFSAAYLHLANAAWILGYPIGRAWQLLRRRECTDPPLLWWDFITHNYLRPRG